MDPYVPLRIGIIGGGQLGRMLVLAGYPLGIHCSCLDPQQDACAGQVGPLLCGPYNDSALLSRLAAGSDVVTYEFENVPVAAAQAVNNHVPVHPHPRVLGIAQDRLLEKRFFEEHGIPVPRYTRVDSLDGLHAALADIGMPAVLKTRTLGYDGKGQEVIQSLDGAKAAFDRLPKQPLILEEYVPFRREVSIIVVRGLDGSVVHYPLCENTHEQGILRQTIVRIGDPLEPRAVQYATRLMTALDYVGVMCLELFEIHGNLLANEIAPRVHNSGHWTIDGACTSQFENHLRAIAGLPLGSTDPIAKSIAMVNCIGWVPNRGQILATPGAHLHLYGKQPRDGGRKIGHVTVCGNNPEEMIDVLLPRLHAAVH